MYLTTTDSPTATLMGSIGDGNSSAYDDADGLVRFDFERMSRVKRRGGRLRQIGVEVADRAGFEPTSPAPKAGRISRLP